MRALVLSGGGALGAYHVGVIKALVEKGVRWDNIAGISVGALNGLQLAVYPKAQQDIATKELEVFWTVNIKGNNSVYKPWLPWKLNYLVALWKGGLNSTKPLRKLLASKFNPGAFEASDVGFTVGTVGLKSGKYITIDLRQPENAKDATTWVLASASDPIFLEPVKFLNDIWIDGGVERQVPFNDVLTIPGLQEVDVVLTGPIGYRNQDQTTNFNNVLNIGTRCVSLVSDQIFDDGLDLVALETKLGIKINVYAPAEPFNYDSFDFSPDTIASTIKLGYADTIATRK